MKLFTIFMISGDWREFPDIEVQDVKLEGVSEEDVCQLVFLAARYGFTLVLVPDKSGLEAGTCREEF